MKRVYISTDSSRGTVLDLFNLPHVQV